MNQTSTELTKKESEALAQFGDVKDFAGFVEEQKTNDDILIPKILAMQGISQLVTDGEATFGDLVDSVTGEKLGDCKEPVKIIPFFVLKTWVVSKKLDGRWEFFERVPVTGGDTNRPYETMVDGVETKNELCYDLYCFQEKKLDLPYVVSLKGASKRTGQKVVTHFTKMLQAGKHPFTYTMNLISKKTKNDKGTYIVMDLVPSDKADLNAMTECARWYKMVKEGIAKVNDAENKQRPQNGHGTVEDQF